MKRARILLFVAAALLVFVGLGCDTGAPPAEPKDAAVDTPLPAGDADAGADSDLCADLGAEAVAGDILTDTADLLADLPGVDIPPVDVPDADDTGGCIDVYPGQVLIAEIMLSPTQAPVPDGQWIELFNAGGDVLKMNGWELCDALDSCVSLALPAGTSFDPGASLVLGFNDTPADNGGLEIDLLVVGIDLSTGSLSLVVPASSIQVDAVDWSAGGWPDTAGAAMSLDEAHYHLQHNDLPASWCPATQPYGYGDLGTPGAKNDGCEAPVTCGDVVTDDGEDCDDGQNGNPLDGCRDDCTFTCSFPAADCEDVPGDCGVPVCEAGGLGQVCAVQPANDPPQDGNPCTQELCDDGIPSIQDLPDGTPCDNSGGAGGDYCISAVCAEPFCGDGIEGPLEVCDDGGTEPGDGCAADCTLEECGNGEIDPLEDCDDGMNGDNGDGCRDDCKFTCKAPLVDCPSSPGDCSMPVCVSGGEGQLCGEVEDVMDPPNDGNACTTDLCQAGVAMHPPKANGTSCDNGAGKVGDYCMEGTCQDPLCGDGVVGPLEGCDDQNLDPCDGCHSNCQTLVLTCGDGFVCGGEQCDDQDADQCDGCLSDCSLHVNVCGDDIVCPPEECDDGGLEDGDGCSAQCINESVQPCPPDMVFVPAAPAQGVAAAFCMDRYEASRQDATAVSMGADVSIAVSQPGVQPWWENPFNVTKLQLFEDACQAAGKHLCEEDEWLHSCAGTAETVYVFGDVFDKDVCNCVDTWCDTYCQDHGIDPVVDYDGCGYSLYYSYPAFGAPFKPTPTGTMPGCVNEFGAYDVNGNVWEIVPDDPAESPMGWPFQVRGGAFNCGGASTRLQCTFEANWTSLYAGFRCCRDPD